jgi:hypothetical protein
MIKGDAKRSQIVNWLCELSENFKLNLRTMHSAVYVFDMCLGKERYSQDKYTALAAVCLLIASKIEELEYNVPKARYYITCS